MSVDTWHQPKQPNQPEINPGYIELSLKSAVSPDVDARKEVQRAFASMAIDKGDAGVNNHVSSNSEVGIAARLRDARSFSKSLQNMRAYVVANPAVVDQGGFVPGNVINRETSIRPDDLGLAA